MLKSLRFYTILTKPENGIISCVRKYSDRNMENQGKYFKQKNNQSHNNQRRSNVNDFRRWMPVASKPQKLGHEITLLNYNILSQRLLEMHSYLYWNGHDEKDLGWNKRFYNLVNEVLYNSPDILCCQEVQANHLLALHEGLRSMNYDVIYKKRTGDKPDGCAIFYRKNIFNLVENHKIEFEQPGIELLDRENVALVCKFELISDPSIKFVVATTHLLYNPRRQDIRLAQVQILLAELDRIAKIPQENVDDEDQNHYPIILSGDFNLQPYSAPYNLIVNGVVKYDNLSSRTLSFGGKGANNTPNGRSLLPIQLGITDECQHVNQEIKLYHSELNQRKVESKIELTKELVNLFQTGVLRHNFNFVSAYPNPEQFVSTFQDKWVLVDYIFYSSSRTKNKGQNGPELKLVSYLKLPSAQDCQQISLKIPNNYLGSDHLMLSARFLISAPSQNDQQSSAASTKL